MQVIDVTEKSIAIRAFFSAKDATTAWELQCRLREELVNYIAHLNDGIHLSKSRLVIENKDKLSD